MEVPTGPDGDFKTLANKLHPHDLCDPKIMIGSRKLDVSNPNYRTKDSRCIIRTVGPSGRLDQA